MDSMNVLFLLMGAVMIMAMHAGFAFLEAGTVSRKNQVNAFNKIIFDWAATTVIYFFIGYPLAYGISLTGSTAAMSADSGYSLVKFFFLVGFAACIPAIISGGVVGRMRFWAQAIAGLFIAALIYPAFEGMVWGRLTLIGQPGSLFEQLFGAPLRDFAGSVVVHSIGGWLALPAIILLGARNGRYESHFDTRPSNIPFLALGSWILIVGWFGFNVMSAQKISDISGLVALNSLMAMAGGTLAGIAFSGNDAGFTHNGALAGLISICAGANVVHPIAALIIGAVAGLLFIVFFNLETQVLKIDDVLGVWPLHGINGTWGGIAVGIFGKTSLGAMEDISFMAQLSGSLAAILYSLATGFILYKAIDMVYGLRMNAYEELVGSDKTFHRIESNPEESL